MVFKYNKKDKLKSKKLIEQLFTEGKAITAYPLRLVYLKTEFEDHSLLKTGVSVSKRLHKTKNYISYYSNSYLFKHHSV